MRSNRRWHPDNQKPPHASGPLADLDHPLMQGCLALLPFTEGRGAKMVNVANARWPAREQVLATPVWTPTSEGMSLDCNSGSSTTSTYCEIPTDAAGIAVPDLTANWTVSVRHIRLAASGADNGLYSRWVNSGSQRQLFVYYSSGNKVQVDVPFIAAIMTSNRAITDTTKIHDVTLTRLGNVWSLYIDGTLDNQVTNSTAQESAPTAFPSFGFSPPNLAKQLQGLITRGALYNRALSPAEVAWQWGSPWAMIPSPDTEIRSYPVPVASGAGGKFFLLFS